MKLAEHGVVNDIQENGQRRKEKKGTLFSTVKWLNSLGSYPEQEFIFKGIHTLQEQYQKPLIPFVYFFAFNNFPTHNAQTVIGSGYWKGNYIFWLDFQWLIGSSFFLYIIGWCQVPSPHNPQLSSGEVSSFSFSSSSADLRELPATSLEERGIKAATDHKKSGTPAFHLDVSPRILFLQGEKVHPLTTNNTQPTLFYHQASNSLSYPSLTAHCH